MARRVIIDVSDWIPRPRKRRPERIQPTVQPDLPEPPETKESKPPASGHDINVPLGEDVGEHAPNQQERPLVSSDTSDAETS